MRRSVLSWIVGFSLLAIVVPVSVSQPPRDGWRAVTFGAAPPAAERQELVVGFTEDQYILEGVRTNLGAFPLNANIVETLTYLTQNYEVKPMLAERWQFRPPQTWRYHLRRGIKFHDGQPWNAKTAKEGLFGRTARLPGGGPIRAGTDSAVVVDEYVLDFTPTVLNLRVPELAVHPNHTSAFAPGTEIGRKPVGTGPFRFVEYRPKERLVVERNPDYWGPKSMLTRIVFRFFPDSTARLLALEAGDIDFAAEISRPDVKRLRASGRLRIATSPVGGYEAIYANVHGKPPYDLLRDVQIRKAIAFAIDRKKLVDGVFDGLAAAEQTWLPQSLFGRFASIVKGYPYDPAKARGLLEEAGWRQGPDGIREKGGRRLKLVLNSGYPSAEIHRPVPAFLQSELRKVGIEIEIVERPDAASFQALITSGEGDLYLEQAFQNDGSVGGIPVLLLYSAGGGIPTSYQSLFWPGPKFDQLLTPSVTAVHPEIVRKAVAEAVSEAVDAQAVIIPLAGLYRIHGMKPGVQGFVAHAGFIHTRWDAVWISR